MRGEAAYLGLPVRSLQTMLRRISAVNAAVTPVIPNGLFGRDTAAAVGSFQRAAGLPATERADLRTWNAVAAAYALAMVDLTPPAVAPQWQISQTVQPGEENGHLYLVQAMLASLERFYAGFTPPAVTGRLDPATAQALAWMQRLSALPETGALDHQTWRSLTALYRAAWGDGTGGRG